MEELEASQAALQDKISQLELSVAAKPNESTEPAAIEETKAVEADAAPSSQAGETAFTEPADKDEEKKPDEPTPKGELDYTCFKFNA